MIQNYQKQKKKERKLKIWQQTEEQDIVLYRFKKAKNDNSTKHCEWQSK